ncbi:MAG: DUF262 domain-containing HNH endonuclease family protein [Halieaceae bacterium]|nr:DUF262 domain-containing HNH endonuclease family protein [Halieaceae bacterium]
MKKIKDLFCAEASSPHETAMLYHGLVGFRIPEYQREYDWSEDNINRLFYDCLGGFNRLKTSKNADVFTFLGTVILVNEDTVDENFKGTSVAIVDGQQRLTTLTLLACALYERLRILEKVIDTLDLRKELRDWLETEVSEQLDELLDCVIGFQRIKGRKTYPYPRIIRSSDYRGSSALVKDYRSPLGKLLWAFAEYSNQEEDEFIPPALGAKVDAHKLGENYQLIRNLVKNINNREWYEDTECEQVLISDLSRAGYRDLLGKLNDVISDAAEQNRALDYFANCSDAHDLIRTLLFAIYFSRCIVLTLVTTEDESAAFDIFDALNTTGEPLTALETLKPRVIKSENEKGNFNGSPSEQAFIRIKENLDDLHKETSQKQSETKELLVSFALYVAGEKISLDLATQRNFLRRGYENAINMNWKDARRFVTAIADLAEFRRFYWTEGGIEELGRFHPGTEAEQAQLYISFIRDMKTKLALPILARYWNPHLKLQGSPEFIEVLKAVTAFLVLRRAASGGTAGIDSDFRRVMASNRGSSRGFGLCAGVEQENKLLTPMELKAALRKLLGSSRQKIKDKQTWVNQVVGNPLYQHSKELVRILLFVAAHQSSPSEAQPGCWKRSRISSHMNNFLTYETWMSELYETVEHIAPESDPGSGWSAKIYKDTVLRQSLGNLVLLPKKENSAIGNDAWQRKKVFYLALTEKTEDKQEERINEAAALGMSFSNYTKKLLKNGECLSLLEPLRNVETWNREVIEARGRNTAELAWDYLWPWLN